MTPAFILLDYLGGISVRVAVLDHLPVYKNLYYAFCVLCGVAVYLLPRWSAVVALFESPVNLVITILGLVLPYVETIKQSDDILTTGCSPALGSSTEHVTNLLLAGGLFLFLGLLCVWAQEALGDMLIVGRGAWNPKRSTAGAVAILGWLFLVLALVAPILDHLYTD